MQTKVSVPCLFYGHNIDGNVLEIYIDVTEAVYGTALIGSRLEERIVDRTSVRILYSCYKYFIESCMVKDTGILCEISAKTYSYLIQNRIFLKGASFSFGILAGMFLLHCNRPWPAGIYTSAEIKFNHKDNKVEGPKIMPIGAASQKATFVLYKNKGNKIYLPHNNVRSLFRSHKWIHMNIISLPKQLPDAISFIRAQSQNGAN